MVSCTPDYESGIDGTWTIKEVDIEYQNETWLAVFLGNDYKDIVNDHVDRIKNQKIKFVDNEYAYIFGTRVSLNVNNETESISFGFDYTPSLPVYRIEGYKQTRSWSLSEFRYGIDVIATEKFGNDNLLLHYLLVKE